MKYFNGILVKSFINPKLVFLTLRNNPKAMGQYNTLVSLLIYLVGFFSIMPVLFKETFFSIGIFTVLLGVFFVILFSIVKVFLYSFIVSQKTSQYVSYQEVMLINTIANVRVIFFFPFLYIFSHYFSYGITTLLFILVGCSMLILKNLLLNFAYKVKGKFVYFISFFMWFLLIPFITLLLVYTGMFIISLF